MNFTKLLISCKEKRQGISNQAFTVVEKGLHISDKTQPKQLRNLHTPNEP